MSLARAQVPLAGFQQVYDHILTYRPGTRNYGNLHLRQAIRRNKRSQLRYLHAMSANPGNEIEGMISGPSVFWHYKMKATRTQTQLQVLVQRSSPQDAARIERRFFLEIEARIQMEQSGEVHYPKRLLGQFYLRRGFPGSRLDHANCQAAIATGALDPRFVSALYGWNLELLRP